MTKLYKQVPVLDSGARGATTTFVQKKIGDVHLAWENEAHLEVREAKGELDLVYPPISIRAEPHVAVVDANVDRKKTRAAAEAYLKYLYTDEAQEIIAKHFYRPINAGDPEEARRDVPGHQAVPDHGDREGLPRRAQAVHRRGRRVRHDLQAQVGRRRSIESAFAPADIAGTGRSV